MLFTIYVIYNIVFHIIEKRYCEVTCVRKNVIALLTAVLTLLILFLPTSAETESLYITAPEEASLGEKISVTVGLNNDKPLQAIQFDIFTTGGMRITSAEIRCEGNIETKIESNAAKIIVISNDVIANSKNIVEIYITLPKINGEFTLYIENAIGVNTEYDTVKLNDFETTIFSQSQIASQTNERIIQNAPTQQTSSSKATRTASNYESHTTRSSIKNESSSYRTSQSRKRNSSQNTSTSKSFVINEEENSNTSSINTSVIRIDPISEKRDSDNYPKSFIYGISVSIVTYVILNRKKITRKIIDYYYKKKFGYDASDDNDDNDDPYLR